MRGPLRQREDGAFLVLWAVLLTALLIMVAIVIDLGGLRDTRRRTQRTADLAAIAAGRDMSAGNDIAACQAAVKYIKSNAADLPAFSDTCSTDFSGTCVATAPLAMTKTSGPYVITIRSPIPASEIADQYLDPATGATVGPEDGKPCERMRVTLQRTNSTFFASVMSTKTLTANGTAVVRGFIGFKPEANAGLVSLERVGCPAIETGGGGSGQASVLVKGVTASDGTPRPGTIQIDTKALSSGGCTSAGNVPSKYAVFGSKLASGADRPNQPSVEAQAIGGLNGRLFLYALAVNPASPNGAYDVPTGVSPAPKPGTIASRAVVDDVYNAGPSNRVSALKSSAVAVSTSLQAAVSSCPTCNTVTASTGENYAVYPPGDPVAPGAIPGADCVSNSATLIDVAASFDKVYVNCPKLDVNMVRFLGTKFAFAGMIKVDSGRMALFPNASEMVVVGCGACTGGNTVAIDVAGAFLVNTGPSTPLTKQCNDNIDNDGDLKKDYSSTFGLGDSGCQTAADWDELSCVQDRTVTSTPSTGPSRLVVSHGPMETSVSAVVEMCQTFMLLADGASLPDQDVSTSVDTTCAGILDNNGVMVPKPCPVTNSYKGYLKSFGTLDWTAPNQTSGPRDTSIADQNFEDLAFWTETSQDTEIKGPGAIVTAGVFFLPNAVTKFSGQASQFIDFNAQFISRRLALSGQGTLSMRPNPDDVVKTPEPYFQLIR